MFADLPRDLPEDIEKLARAVAPVLCFDANEPFLPTGVGISVLTAPGQAISADRQITFEPGVVQVIEFSIWWDWDIQHLYELEHVWVKLDGSGAIVGVTASAHGGQFDMRRTGGELAMEAGRVVLYSEPGKHAFHPDPSLERADERMLRFACSGTTLPGASLGHILVNDTGRDVLPAFSGDDHRRVRRFLQRKAFVPRFAFTRQVDLAELPFASWPALKSHIGRRVPEIVGALQAAEPLIKAVFVDSGDTLVDEATEVREDGVVTSADLLPGAREMMFALAEEGYRLCLVADGRVKSFDNVHGTHGLTDLFEARVISEQIGCEKPDARMFKAALGAMKLSAEDADACVMIGNNLARDIEGANALGMRTIWIDWSPRRAGTASTLAQISDHIVTLPSEVPRLLERIEHDMFEQKRRRDMARPQNA